MHGSSKSIRFFKLLLFICLFQIPLARAALIEIQPGFMSAGTGDSVSLDLVVSGLGESGPDSLGAFDISVGFDVSALSFTGYSLGGYLGDIGIGEAIDASSGDTGGAVNVAEVSLLSEVNLDTLQPGAFTVATLNFDIIDLEGGAATQLSILSGPILADASGFALSEVTTSGPATIESQVQGVPLPGTPVLFIAALIAWLSVRREADVTGK